jgi:hypothetical protein
MSVLLIGGDSYVGRSISSEFERLGKSVTSFSKKKIFSKYSYSEFNSKLIESHQFAVVVGTPGHFRANNKLSDNAMILNSLSQSGLNVYVISTIHTLVEPLGNENEYVRLNLEFEEIALHYRFKVIRIPNFIGYTPKVSDNQARLLPWSLLENFLTHGCIQLRSNLDSRFEWITSGDLCNAILILESNSALGNVELQPGYKCSLGDLVRVFSEFATEKYKASVSVQEMNLENDRKIISGVNPMGALGWKTELTGKIMYDYIGEYLHKNWSHRA